MASRKRTDGEDDSPDARRRAREEAQRQIEARNRERDEWRRRRFSHFGMWKICPDRRCMRAHACRGDVERCLRDRWHVVVPADLKALLYKTSELMRDGYGAQEALAAARRDMAHRRELDARLAAHKAASPPAPARPAPPARAPRPGPRIRSL